jgi:hypothetical protein
MSRITKRTCLILIIMASLMSSSLAQDSIPSLSAKPRKPGSFWHRVSVGGDLGFQFGTVTGINLAPEVRVRTIDQLHVGLRFIYQYYKYKRYFLDTRTNQYLDFRSSVYGGGVYLRYYLSSIFDNFLGNLFAHAEFEYLTYSRPYTLCDPPEGYILDIGNSYYKPGKQMIGINSLFIGGGYRQPIGNRVAMELMLLYNLNESNESPYSNPVFRLGVSVGL